MSSRALVVHASDLLAKGWVAIAPDRPNNALLGVVRGLRLALSSKDPDRAVAVVADRDWPAPLDEQAARLEDVLRAHGLPIVRSDAPEHLVASYVRSAPGSVVVVGGDKRLAQLVGPQAWWVEPFKGVRYTPDAIRKRFEVPPDRVAGWLALVGDDDALAGVKGIGRKGATELIERFGSVEAALDGVDEVEGRTGKALRAGMDAAREQLAVAVLRDVPLPVPWDELVWAPPSVEALNELYAELGFYRLLQADAVDVEATVCRTDAEIAAALASLPEPVALHPVIEDPSPPRGRLVGLAVGNAYVPLPDEVPPSLAAWLADPARPKVGHDVHAAVTALARRGVDVRGVVGDSAIASHLHQPSGWAPHELGTVAQVVLQRPVRDDTALRGKGAGRKAWSDVPVDDVAAHAVHLAETAGELWRALEPTTPAEPLAEALALSRTLTRMELHGMLVDRDELSAAGEDWDRTVDALAAEVHALVGHPFNLGSTKQLGEVLFAELGLPVLSRTKTGWSTATAVLERLAHEHPVVPLVIRWRELTRLRDTWVTALLASLDGDGRVRSTVHPARSFTGRLVNSDPDLGRVPGRTETMSRIRRAFVAPPGSKLLSVDYQQLGLFVLAHLTGDPALAGALARGDDLHRLTAAAVLDKAPEDVTLDERQTGKVVNFATFAGQGASALGMQLGIAPQEAKRMIERFDAHYAVVRAFQDEQLRLARERGWIETIAGRRWPIGDLDSLDPHVLQYAERLARRATHEGSVADVSRRGLLRADEALRAAGLRAVPLLQVHDEVVFEVPDDELPRAAEVCATAMREAWDLLVPLRVGVEAGPNWADLEPLRGP